MYGLNTLFEVLLLNVHILNHYNAQGKQAAEKGSVYS